MKVTTKMWMSVMALAVAMVPAGMKAQSLVPVAYGQGPYGGEVPGPHPAYIHALSDLRAARHYLADGWAWGPVRHDDDMAIREIDAAIVRIKQAAIDDGKRLDDPFPIDSHLSPHDRFHQANQLLFAAAHDLDRAEDVPQSRGLRNDALAHINRAHQIVDNAWRTAHWE